MIMLHWWRLELPPRARRILRPNTGLTTGNGTTSACAENTPDGAGTPWIPRNYLRVRGEYFTAPQHPHAVRELPPRARRILTGAQSMTHTMGTTSACAENTPAADHCGEVAGNYLRVRGEYARSRSLRGGRGELPPRARRIPKLTQCYTPICWNYLRVRGEYLSEVQDMP